jgi:hypothetical protein
MSEIEICGSCHVPRMIAGVFNWDDNGVISIAGNPDGRMVFYESGNIDSIIHGVGELIGVTIEHIAIERKRRDTRRFMEGIFADAIEKVQKLKGDKPLVSYSTVDPGIRKEGIELGHAINAQATSVGMVYGYGKIRFCDLWEFWDSFPWRTQIIQNPYSIAFFAADMLATVEALEQQDMQVKYEQVTEKTYILSVRPGKHPIGLRDRLKKKSYAFKAGDIAYEKCPDCGVPLDVGRCRWDLESGTIVDPDTDRRMAIFDPAGLDTVFESLEEELGESVTDVIIEAQRLYAKESMAADNWRRSGYDFKSWAAMRGLGNITSFKADRERMTMTLENSCMHLALVGMTQALYELAWGAEESHREWHRSDDGNLEIEITF